MGPGPQCYMFKVIDHRVPEKKMFEVVFTVYGHVNYFGHVTQISRVNVNTSLPLMLDMQVFVDWPSGFGDVWK